MTEEEMKALIDSQAETISNLTAERDSLAEENTTLREAAAKVSEELASTKKLNFTLSRQLDTAPAIDPGEILREMFNRG